ncbi:MAG: sigma-70 family RNA polymerase sigma factor [Colwelliaceae bacterium]|nr:sigma-70 family RNA polymerase sigma factor [Colwelliaceae bacterium]
MIEQVWRDFHQQLLMFIVKKVDSVDVAEDILQEVFIKVNQQIEQLREQDKLASWLYMICRNAIIDYYRKNRNNNTQIFEANMDVFIGELSKRHENESLHKCIATLINELDETYRQVIEDSEIFELKQAKIAERNHISLSATKSRIKRGKEKLKEKLKQCCIFEFSEQGITHHCKNRCGCQ